ncbi:MAG: hypothetical protein WC901_01910 [Candidatus Margulisiibacteriota bacterium]
MELALVNRIPISGMAPANANAVHQFILLADINHYISVRVSQLDLATQDLVNSQGLDAAFDSVGSVILDSTQQDLIAAIFSKLSISSAGPKTKNFFAKLLPPKVGDKTGRDLQKALSVVDQLTLSALGISDPSKQADLDKIKSAMKQMLILKDILNYQNAVLSDANDISDGIIAVANATGIDSASDKLLPAWALIRNDAAITQVTKNHFDISGAGTKPLQAQVVSRTLPLKSSNLDYELAYYAWVNNGVPSLSELGDKFGKFVNTTFNIAVGTNANISIQKIELADRDVEKRVIFNLGDKEFSFNLSEEFASVPQSERGNITFQYSNGGRPWQDLGPGVLVDTASTGTKTITLRAKWNGWVIQQQQLTINVIAPPQITLLAVAPSPEPIARPGNGFTDLLGTSLRQLDVTDPNLFLKFTALENNLDPTRTVAGADSEFGSRLRVGVNGTNWNGTPTSYYLMRQSESFWGLPDIDGQLLFTVPIGNDVGNDIDKSRDGIKVDRKAFATFSGGVYGYIRDDQSAYGGGSLRLSNALRVGEKERFSFARDLSVRLGQHTFSSDYPSVFVPSENVFRLESHWLMGLPEWSFGPEFMHEGGMQVADIVLEGETPEETPVSRQSYLGKSVIDFGPMGVPIKVDLHGGWRRIGGYEGLNEFNAYGQESGSGGQTSSEFTVPAVWHSIFSGVLETKIPINPSLWPWLSSVGGGVIGFMELDEAGNPYSRVLGGYLGVGDENLLRLSIQSGRQFEGQGIPQYDWMDLGARLRVPVTPKLWSKKGVVPALELYGNRRQISISGTGSSQGRNEMELGGNLVFSVDRPDRGRTFSYATGSPIPVLSQKLTVSEAGTLEYLALTKKELIRAGLDSEFDLSKLTLQSEPAGMPLALSADRPIVIPKLLAFDVSKLPNIKAFLEDDNSPRKTSFTLHLVSGNTEFTEIQVTIVKSKKKD